MNTIEMEVKDKVGYVTLDRGPANALTNEMYREIADAFYALGEREDVAVIILRANGKIFCGGNDLSIGPSLTKREAAEEIAWCVSRAVSSIWDCKKPVIAAVQGACMGAGFGLAVAADFIIAGSGVSFAIPEVNLGIPAAGCFAEMCLPIHIAKRMAFAGEAFTSEQLEHYGVVMQVVEKDEVWDAADAFAARIASSCYRAAGVFKQTFNRNVNPCLHESFLAEQHSFMNTMMHSHDFHEATAAFMEKRKPVFNGQ